MAGDELDRKAEAVVWKLHVVRRQAATCCFYRDRSEHALKYSRPLPCETSNDMKKLENKI